MSPASKAGGLWPSPPSQMPRSAASVSAVRALDVVRCGVLKHRLPDHAGITRTDGRTRTLNARPSAKLASRRRPSCGNRCSARLSYVRVMAYFQQKPPAPNSRTGGCRYSRLSAPPDPGLFAVEVPGGGHGHLTAWPEPLRLSRGRPQHLLLLRRTITYHVTASTAHWQTGNCEKVGVDRLTPARDIPLWARRRPASPAVASPCSAQR